MTTETTKTTEAELSPTAWIADQQRIAQNVIDGLQSINGTYVCDNCTVYAHILGYKKGLTVAMRRLDQ